MSFDFDRIIDRTNTNAIATDGFREHLLDDETPLQSYLEEESEGPYAPCSPAELDEDACEAAVNPPEM